MYKDKITIVTALFNCGRDKVEFQTRADNCYIEYFKFWARIKNEVVVYTSQNLADKIINVRKQFGLEDRTKIIIIDDIWKIEADLLQEMCVIENKAEFIKLRIRRDDISNQAKYNYIMLMKYWFMKDAVERKIADSQVAWLDFGYNHGGAVFSNAEDFEFEWKYNFSNKIQLFARKEQSEEMGLVKLLSMSDSIMGAPVIAPANLCDKLYELCRDAMWALVTLDCYDDDQALLRMAYKRMPSIFELHMSDWFLPIKEYGGGHIRINEQKSFHSFNAKDYIINLMSEAKKVIFPNCSRKDVKAVGKNIEKAIMRELS